MCPQSADLGNDRVQRFREVPYIGIRTLSGSFHPPVLRRRGHGCKPQEPNNAHPTATDSAPKTRRTGRDIDIRKSMYEHNISGRFRISDLSCDASMSSQRHGPARILSRRFQHRWIGRSRHASPVQIRVESSVGTYEAWSGGLVVAAQTKVPLPIHSST